MNELKETELVRRFEEIARELIKRRASSVAIWVRWENGIPTEIDHEFDVGVCECGEWAEYCRGCYDSAYEDGKRDGKVEAERWW